MSLTPEQVKGRIKHIAQQNNVDARILMRTYMMERFLERIAHSPYKNNFVIKGGVLIAAMVGITLRSTMDIDTSIKQHILSEKSISKVFETICQINLLDGVHFEVTRVFKIMHQLEYPGLRLSMNAHLGDMVTPLKIDISTGDIITPHAISYNYKLLLEDRTISLWSYNLETILAEKFQTILARGMLNTRMRDFYDIHILLSMYKKGIDESVLRNAFSATCKRRATENLVAQKYEIFSSICADKTMKKHWGNYQKKYTYAASISYEDILLSLGTLLDTIFPPIPNATTRAAMTEVLGASNDPTPSTSGITNNRLDKPLS